MRFRRRGRHKRVRYDRVLARTPDWVVNDASLFGTEPVEEGVWVSVTIGVLLSEAGTMDVATASYAGYIGGAVAGGLSSLFLQPLFGATIFGDRRPAPAVRVTPSVSATPRGGMLGLNGAF